MKIFIMQRDTILLYNVYAKNAGTTTKYTVYIPHTA